MGQVIEIGKKSYIKGLLSQIVMILKGPYVLKTINKCGLIMRSNFSERPLKYIKAIYNNGSSGQFDKM